MNLIGINAILRPVFFVSLVGILVGMGLMFLFALNQAGGVILVISGFMANILAFYFAAQVGLTVEEKHGVDSPDGL
jgi:hypothetical protein